MSSSVEILRALGDDIRLGLVRKIATGDDPQKTCEIIQSCSELTSLSQPTISHHIAKLVAAGVLIEEKQAKQKAYTVDFNLLEKHGIDINKI